MYEQRTRPLLPTREFVRRQIIHFTVSLSLLFGSLLLGILGYHLLGGLGWVDSLENAAMILGGMGPVDGLSTTAGKVFASFYALYSGIIFLIAAAVLFAPLFHRFLHRFHLEQEADDQEADNAGEQG
jgi:hypothetical protein